jgi:moderate conductance mechanosensitive channel
MATGRVLARFGDVHGPVVNLAALLTSLARPGTALVEVELAAALRADGGYRLQQRRLAAARGHHHLRSWALRPQEYRLKPSPGSSHSQVIGTKSTAFGGYVVSVMSLHEISMWGRGRGLEIVLLIVGAILLTRLIAWLRDHITRRIDANAREADALVRSEAAKHRHALAQVITWATVVVIYSATAILVAERLGIPLTSLVAPAAVVAVALGFGAQRIVQDLLAGFFIITERQYGFGDLVRLSVPSVSTGALGTVEDVTLRVTSVRTVDGEVVITPNGQIGQVTNLSRGWARAVVDVPVPATVDVNRVSDLLRQIGEQAYEEPELRQLLLDPPAVMGVQSIDVTQFQVRLVARTLPGKQFDVGRMLRARVAAGLLREGISLPAGVETIAPNGAG